MYANPAPRIVEEDMGARQGVRRFYQPNRKFPTQTVTHAPPTTGTVRGARDLPTPVSLTALDSFSRRLWRLGSRRPAHGASHQARHVGDWAGSASSPPLPPRQRRPVRARTSAFPCVERRQRTRAPRQAHQRLTTGCGNGRGTDWVRATTRRQVLVGDCARHGAGRRHQVDRSLCC